MSAPKPKTESTPTAARPPRIWAFAGGTGGVGRSFLAANLAIQLDRAGHRVVLIDADFDAPTLHAFLGRPAAHTGLRRLFRDKSARLGDCLDRVGSSGFRFAAGMEGPIRGVPAVVERLAEDLAGLQADFVLLDLGSTRTPSMQQLFRTADQGLIVVTPEPLSLVGALGYLSQLFGRDTAENAPGENGTAATIPPLGIVVNRARTDRDPFPAAALRSGLNKLLGVGTVSLGSVPEDEAVARALAHHRPLSLQYPNTPSARAIAVLIERLETRPAIGVAESRERPAPLARSDHYDVLEVPRHATSRQIQSAYEDLKKVYRPASPYLPAATDSAHLAEITRRVEQAYRTLIFLETRREYDRTLRASGGGNGNGGGSRPSATLVPPTAGDTKVPPPPETGIDGAYMRQVRTGRRISLESICEATKIRKVHLQCIEADDFDGLPAPVFLRGFLRAYAGCLDLDPDEVCRGFMDRFSNWEQSRQTRSDPRIPDPS